MSTAPLFRDEVAFLILVSVGKLLFKIEKNVFIIFFQIISLGFYQIILQTLGLQAAFPYKIITK